MRGCGLKVSCDWWRPGHVTPVLTSDWSRPDPVITWWLGDTFLAATQHVTTKVEQQNIFFPFLINIFPLVLLYFLVCQVGNISKSVLTLRPRHEDDQKVLTCRAENTEMEEGALQDSWRLTVHCKC